MQSNFNLFNTLRDTLNKLNYHDLEIFYIGDINRELIFNMIESHISNKGMVVLSTHEKGRILNIKNTKELVIE